MSQLKEIQSHLFDLEIIIDEKQRQLEAYANKPNASKSYIMKGNKQSQLLVSIHNYLSSIDIGIGGEINNIINNARKKDPNAGGILINISFLIGNEHRIYAEINPSYETV